MWSKHALCGCGQHPHQRIFKPEYRLKKMIGLSLYKESQWNVNTKPWFKIYTRTKDRPTERGGGGGISPGPGLIGGPEHLSVPM